MNDTYDIDEAFAVCCHIRFAACNTPRPDFSQLRLNYGRIPLIAMRAQRKRFVIKGRTPLGRNLEFASIVGLFRPVRTPTSRPKTIFRIDMPLYETP